MIYNYYCDNCNSKFKKVRDNKRCIICGKKVKEVVKK